MSESLKLALLIALVAAVAVTIPPWLGPLVTNPSDASGPSQSLLVGATLAGAGTLTTAPSTTRGGGATTTTVATTTTRPPTTTRKPKVTQTTKATTTKAAPPKTTKPRTTTTSAGSGAASSDAKEVLRLTNVERASNGCGALAWNTKLASAASKHSTDMAQNDYFSHDGLDGRDPFERIKDEGYSFSSAAENIAAGQPTPEAVVEGWMSSSGHRANILNCGLKELGVGVAHGGSYGVYWTQDFGTPS